MMTSAHELLLFGAFGDVPTPLLAAGVVAAVAALGYRGAPLWLWTAAAAATLWGCAAAPWVWAVAGVPSLLLNVRLLRRHLLSAPLMRGLSGPRMPSISDTERVALEAGTAWIERDFFTGRPDFGRILAEPYPDLADAERAFLDGPTDAVCRMTDDWAVHQERDLPAHVWQYLKQERFFGLAIPARYGGLEFSATAMSAVVARLASRSVPLAVTVMVPNSLGPAELLVQYGTQAQKDHYLPRLATGQEIPCFALTESEAGSDAAALSASGEVFAGADGELYLRLNWRKRFITLGAISTLLGLAFRLRDPANLLGKGVEPGITCALIPTDLPGVVLGRRHDPLGVPFINSPTEGHDVVVPVRQILGGPEQAGNGWRMLMETLAAGRGIFLPALNSGSAKLATRVCGAYAGVRRQFGLPIGRFEGVQELLAPIAGWTYLLEALSRFTCGAVDRGVRPAVVSAIAKCHSSDLNRRIVNHAMDILGGAGIVLGPRNLMGRRYAAVPIGITVEGSNVLTRSLIIFGQGLVRGHPHALAEIHALQRADAAAFDRALCAHVGLVVRNAFRAALLSLTRGRLAGAPAGAPLPRYVRRLSWAAATFAVLADVALLALGARLKRREQLSGRFADVLSWLCLGTAALRKFDADGRRAADLPFVHWSLQYALAQIQTALEGICANLPVPLLRPLCCGPLALWLRLNPLGRPPADALARTLAGAVQEAGERRDRLTCGIHLPRDPDEPLARLERAFDLAGRSEEPLRRIRDAVRAGRLQRDAPERLLDAASGSGVIDASERLLLAEAEEARADAIRVDAFDLQELPVRMEPVARPGGRRGVGDLRREVRA